MSTDSIFTSWKKQYSWDNCKLNNGDYGRFLSSYLRTQKSPLVMNLDGGWGTGKTTFLKQLYTDLHYTHDYACIYIDAWESDYSNDPLLVIVSELLEQIKRVNQHFKAADTEKRIFTTLGKFSKRAWNTTAIGVGTYLSGRVDNGAVVELAKQFTFSDADAAIVGTNLTTGYKQQKSALNDARESLEALVDYCLLDKKKVFVLIDELDRCRPSYAIEMLETIKHFFELKNYIFVVATDTEQLSHSVKAVYGDRFDGKEYLSRFFSRSAKLPQPNLKDFSKIMVEKMSDDNLKSVFSVNGCPNIKDSLTNSFSELGEIYAISLRRLEQISNKFESIVAYSTEVAPQLLIDANLLIQLLIEFDSSDYRIIYEARKQSKSNNITMPKTIVDKSSNTGSNPLRCVANIIHGHEYSNKKDNSLLLDKYHFSWLFSTYPRRIKNQSSFKVIDIATDYLRYLSSNSDTASTQIRNHLSYIKKQCNQLDEEYKIALPEDYYKFVELAKLQSV
ncbi:hypothetical protein KZN62_000367 [Vibrio cholerae]|nr:hypothetical protein [Vibrio cholerae]EHV9951740.1 hypothetical protein [Vibrio cholerae]